ncbi:MAG: ATP-dependent endonuclease [Rhodospirillaceae bacterium]|nr:ATP-dependent endonuclease [Rhodospirillaceae bacterium]
MYGRKIRFLAAGRSSPFEHFRSSVESPNHINSNDAAVGNIGYRQSWWNIESLTGDLLALDARADLKLKVEARLQQLLDRSVDLTWSQQGLTLRISSMRGGGSYPANHEASGILQLVGLLAAIHNDEIGALIIDEPEVSLHPQHQAFVLDEMERVAGDPVDRTKKLIIFATHAPSLLPLRSEQDLPHFAFFNDISEPPAQIRADEFIPKSTKLKALIARLSETHRMAMFAERVLLLEGPSDETIITQLARRLDWPLLARNAQVLPVTGKGEFPEVAKIFGLMKKQVGVLADLDALADDNGLVNFFSSLPGAEQAASRRGAKSIVALDGDLRTDLGAFMVKYSEAVDRAAKDYPDWSAGAPPDMARKRVTLARLLTAPATFSAESTSSAIALSQRYAALLEMLGDMGCFFLRAGAIENYYASVPVADTKPSAAASEATTFRETDVAALNNRYADALKAVRYIAPARGVEEARLLRPKLGAAITAVFQSMTRTTPADQLNAIAKSTIGASAEVFSFENLSTTDQLKLEIAIVSPLFEMAKFPIQVSHGQNINQILPEVLPFTEA